MSAQVDYDVLIVGAGSSGSVIAPRLSENPNLHVALIVAGPDYTDLADTPFDLINPHNNSYTDHDWDFAYQPIQHRSDRFPRGRVVGGWFAVNITSALRGMPEDYGEWAEASSDDWSWRKVLPVFKHLERDLDFPDAPYYGGSASITIRCYPTEELVP